MTRLLLAALLPLAVMAADDPDDTASPGAFILRQLDQHRAPETPAPQQPETQGGEEVQKPKVIGSHLPTAAIEAMKAIPGIPKIQPKAEAPPVFTPPAPEAGRATFSPDYGFILWSLLQWWLWLSVCRFAICFVLRRFGLLNPEHVWLFSLLWPWRPLYRRLLNLFRHGREVKHGEQATARWTPFLEMLCLQFRRGDILFGRARAWLGIPLLQPVGWFVERHIVALGMTGAGKTLWLISLLALSRGNVLAIDVAAQMINAIGRRLGKGARGVIGLLRDVHVLDPKGLSRYIKTSIWNLWCERRRWIKEFGPQRATSFDHKAAEAMIKPELNPANAWITDDARAFASGLIPYIAEREPREKQNLVRFRELITIGLTSAEAKARGVKISPDKPQSGFRLLLEDMKNMGGVIASAAAVMETAQGNDGRNIPRSALLEQTRYLDLPEIQGIVTGESGFDLFDGKTGKLCLFICASVLDIRGTMSGFFRLVTTLSMEIYRELDKVWLKHSTTVFADELPALGFSQAILDIGPEGRKHGLRLIAAATDLEGIQATYPRHWGSFLSNAEATVFATLNHKPTIDYALQRLGTATRNETVAGGRLAGLFSKIMVRGQKVERPLLYNTQFEDMLHPDARTVLVLRLGRPLKLKAAKFTTELPVYFYEADPRYPEKPGRRIGRWLCERLIPGPQEPAEAAAAASGPADADEPGSTSHEAAGGHKPNSTPFDDAVGTEDEIDPAADDDPAGSHGPNDQLHLLQVFEHEFNFETGRCPDEGLRLKAYETLGPVIAAGGDDIFSGILKALRSRKFTQAERDAILGRLMAAIAAHS